MSILVIGISDKTAPIALREKVFFAPDKLACYLQDLLNSGLTEEAVLLSTCNRSELYCNVEDIQPIRDWFCAQTTLPRSEVEPALYIFQEEEAVKHLMKVACGLDSMILGEPQILGQVKEAFSESCAAGAVNTIFHRLFQQVLSTAKEIRSTTAIGACPVSVASAASRFVREKVKAFAEARIVLVGAGETAALLLRYLHTQVDKPITLVNRHFEKAHQLIQSFGGKAVPLDYLCDAIVSADVVFTATGSPLPLVTKDMMEEVMKRRQFRSILLLDMAVPRNIDPLAANIEGVQSFCIDDLKEMISLHKQGREHAAQKAYEMICQKSRDFIHELTSFNKVAHTIRAYRGQIEAICRAELHKAKHELHQGMDPSQVLDTFAHAFTQKLLHAPSVQLRQAGAEGRFELLSFAKQLFAISDPELEHL